MSEDTSHVLRALQMKTTSTRLSLSKPRGCCCSPLSSLPRPSPSKRSPTPSKMARAGCCPTRYLKVQEKPFLALVPFKLVVLCCRFVARGLLNRTTVFSITCPGFFHPAEALHFRCLDDDGVIKVRELLVSVSEGDSLRECPLKHTLHRTCVVQEHVFCCVLNRPVEACA